MNDVIKWCNENQGFVMVLLTTMYVLLTATLAIVGFRANALGRRQLNQAVEMEKGRIRPMVVCQLSQDPPVVEAIVRNYGQTAARDICFDIKPEVMILGGGKGAFPKEETERNVPFMKDGIAILPAQGEIKSWIGVWSRVESRYPALNFQGTISYQDLAGNQYSEPVVLDLNSEKGLLRRERKDIEDVAKQLEEIAKTLGHLSTGFHQPLVRTIDETEYRKEQERQFEEARQQLEQIHEQQAGGSDQQQR
jgi:hypothetical protein